MSTDATYKFGEATDSETESARLKRQAEILAAAELAALIECGLPDRGVVLDVGCGPGFFAQRLLQTRPELQVIGVDVADVALRQSNGTIMTLKGDARSLPLRDGIADLAYARIVLKHVPRPESAIAEMARSVRPGGVVVVEDTDHASLVLYPELDGYEEMLHARHELMQRRGADPRIARRLPSLLRQAGLADVTVRILPLSTEQIGVATFASIVLSGFATAIDAGLIPEHVTRRWTQSVAEWTKHPDAFGWFTVLFVSGIKPIGGSDSSSTPSAAGER